MDKDKSNHTAKKKSQKKNVSTATSKTIKSTRPQLSNASKKLPSDEALCESTAILDSMRDPAFTHDEEFRIVYANQAYLKKANLPFKKVIGKYYWEVFPKLDCTLPSTLRAKKSKQEEVENIILPLGKIYRSRSLVIQDKRCNTQSFFTHFFEDITSQLKVEKALEESLLKLNSISSAAQDAILLINTQGKVVYWNNATEKMFGYSYQEIEDKNVQQLLEMECSKSDDKHIIGYFIKKGRLEEPNNLFELVGRKSSKANFPVELSFATVTLQDKLHAVFIIRDITIRKQIETELKHRVNFEHIINDISKFFAKLHSHEIDQGIQHALETIGKFASIDRSYLFLFSDDRLTMSNAHEWHADGVASIRKKSQNLLIKHFPWFSKAIETDEAVYVPEVNKLPKECQAEKQQWQQDKIISLINVPIMLNGIRIGFVGFDTVRIAKTWTKQDISLLQTIGEILGQAVARKRADEEKQKSEVSLKNSLIKTVQALAQTIEKRDPYTAGHQQRVSLLAKAIAEEMQLTAAQIEGITLGALIHDIGKIYIPADILTRSSALNKTEFALVKLHPGVGYDIIKDINFPWPIQNMVLYHHERMDGSGYPKGLKGKNIPLEARILAVADVVEAMNSHRPYRPALGIDAALKEISKQKNTLYDPVVADICIKLFRKKNFTFNNN